MPYFSVPQPEPMKNFSTWVASALCIKWAFTPVEIISSINGLSDALVCRPQGGLEMMISESPISKSSLPISSCTTSTCSSKPRDAMFLRQTEHDSSSISTNNADFAPKSTAPIPRMPFPDPKSATLQSSEISSKARISLSQRAAKSPPVWYCSNSNFCAVKPSSFESSIARVRRRMLSREGDD